ncbi:MULTISPECIES: hypothetical protein [Pseudomonas]|nr:MULTISPECIES: hypothetical protein [Pseudomonas]AXQ51131.1 hypothetical protein DZC31_31115 [Stenotrophomonas rhizophila]MCO6692694.1 hypothetical protein [Pseudomonas shirazica]ESW38588.1 hypothetical protein O164_17005 [Pseudomonas taiwanensis SJ9]MCE0755566.1 hypothetical protein [Pseudomonas asiatica]MCE0981537.1 hypothetical protein [Pseudomonas monteilii]
MKAIVLAAMAALAVNASAAESIVISTELTRNGDIVDAYSVTTQSGVRKAYRNIEYKKYRKLINPNKARLANLELGSTAYFTPYVASDGTVRLTMDVNYVHLADMGTDKAGGLVVDYPRTDGYRLSITDVIPSGGKREYKDNDNGDEYVYTVSVDKQ